MTALSGRSAKIKVTAATGTASTGEALSEVATTTDVYTYRITDSSKRHWDRSASVVLYRNSTAVSAADYTITHAVGEVAFGQPQSTGETMTADITWLAASYLGQSRGWDLEVETDMLDVTTLSTSTGDVQWREFATGLSGAAVSIDRIVKTTTGPTFFDRINADQDLVAELIVSGTNKYEGYALVEGDELETMVEALAGESVTLRMDGPVSYTTL